MSSIKFYLMNALAVFMISTCSLTSVLADENTLPEVVVTNFQDGLLNIMKSSKTLTTQQRYKKLEPILDSNRQKQKWGNCAMNRVGSAHETVVVEFLEEGLERSFEKTTLETGLVNEGKCPVLESNHQNQKLGNCTMNQVDSGQKSGGR